MDKLFISDVAIKGKRCFIRVDFNVPLDQFGNITSDIRIKAALPTINHAIDEDAKVIIASHIGRPKGMVNDKLSMKLIVKRLSRLLGKNVFLASDCIGPEVDKMIENMSNGDVLLLENLRFHNEEEANDKEFAKKLAANADVFVNDAFGAAHRTHASTEGITHFVKYSVAGFLMKKEIEYFDKAVAHPAHPSVAILGGAKTSGKIMVMHNLMKKVDKIIVGGGLAFTFYKSLGYDVGKSVVDESMIGEVKKIRDAARERGVKFYLPVDFVVAESMDAEAETKVVPGKEIPKGWMALDIGPASSILFREVISNAKTIIWNGPMGMFEMDQFSRGTMRMVRDIADCYALTIVGGGDTDVAVYKGGEADRISYISTGGGAFLELLEGKILPGIEALTKREEN